MRARVVVASLWVAALLGVSCGGGQPEVAPSGGGESSSEAMDSSSGGSAGAGGGGTSAAGMDVGGGDYVPGRPPPPPPPSTPGTVRLTGAEQQTVMSYGGSMLQLERDLTNAIPQSGGADCGTACQASESICDLATRICGIATRHPSDVELAERCEDARSRCAAGQERVARAGCSC